MGFDLHQDMRGFLVEIIFPGLVVREETPHFGTFHYRRVVFISRQHVVRSLLKGIFDHFEQRLRLLFTVNHPVGVKDFMAAMFGVGLSEHIQFDIVRVTPQSSKRILQIVDFIFGQRQAETNVGLFQRGASMPLQIDALHRCRLMMGKQLLRLIQRGKHGFHHTVMQPGGNLLPLGLAQGAGFDIVRHAAFKALNACQAAVVGNVGGLGRPGGDGAGTRRDHNQAA